MVENSILGLLESVLKKEILKWVFQPIRNDIETESINRINDYSDDDKNPENETISKILNSLYSQLYRLNQDERTVDNMLGILISNINIQEASNYFPVSLKSRIDTVVISNSWNGSYPFKYTKPDSFIEMFIESDNYKKSISIIKKYLALQML